MTAGVIAEAAGLFAVTNLDDIVILSLFFAQGAGQRGSARRVIAGQYLAFTAILAVAIAITSGARFLPEEALPYLGLLPIALGLRDAWKVWRNRKSLSLIEVTGPLLYRNVLPPRLSMLWNVQRNTASGLASPLLSILTL